MDVIIAGDDVSRRKPHPMIYNLARQRLNIDYANNCLVIEDSLIGLTAAKGAEMKCLITYTDSTVNEDFYLYGANAKLKDLNGITLHDIESTWKNLLSHKRDCSVSKL